jgi:hypothetical protein
MHPWLAHSADTSEGTTEYNNLYLEMVPFERGLCCHQFSLLIF